MAEGVDRRETDIPRTRRVAPVLLDVIQKRRDKRGIEIIEGEGRWGLAELLLSKPKEEPKRIAVRRDGVRARVLLTDESVGKETLHKTRKRRRRGHGAPALPAPRLHCTGGDRKSTRLNSSHSDRSRMPSSA